MKLGVFTVAMPEYDIEESAKLLKKLGYDGIEWRVKNRSPETKPEDYTFERRYWNYNKSTLDIENIEKEVIDAKEVCDESSIEICALTTYLTPWDEEKIEKVLKAAKSITCKNIRVNAPSYNESENYNVLFDRTIKQVKKIEKLAEKYEVRINFEIHMGNIIPSASSAYRFASNFNPKNIGIIHDAGNMVYEGFENYKLGIELLGEYLAHVHIKNAVWTKGENDEFGAQSWQPTWAPLTKGYADIKKLIKVLKEVNYQEYLSIEDFSNEEETEDKLKNNLDYLKKILKETITNE